MATALNGFDTLGTCGPQPLAMLNVKGLWGCGGLGAAGPLDVKAVVLLNRILLTSEPFDETLIDLRGRGGAGGA